MVYNALMPSWLLADWMLWILTALVGLVGFILAFRGLFGDRAKGRPYCWKCRYDMANISTLTCPECGHVHMSRKHLFKTRRYYKRFAVGALLFMVALHCHTGPEVQKRRSLLGEKWWESVTPTTVWIVMLPELGEERLDFLEGRLQLIHDEIWTGFRVVGEDTTFYDPDYWFVVDPIILRDQWQAGLLARSLQRILQQPQPMGTTAASGTTKHEELRDRVFRMMISLRRQVDLIPACIELAKDPSETIRRDALLAMSMRREDAQRVMPALLTALDDPDMDVRAAACQALGHLGRAGRPAIPKLLALLHERSYDPVPTDTPYPPGRAFMSQYAARTLIRMGPDCVAQVLATMREDEKHLLDAIHDAMAPMGRELTDSWHLFVAAGFKQKLGDYKDLLDVLPRSGIRMLAIPDNIEAARLLFAGLRSEDRMIRNRSDRVIRETGLPLIEWAAKQDNLDYHQDCISFMMGLGEKGGHLAPQLVRSMLREPERFRESMMDMLAQIGPPPVQLYEVLLDAVDDPRPATATMAVRAFALIAPAEEKRVMMLIQWLARADAVKRRSAIRLLEELGPQATLALPRLRELAAGDADETVRRAARHAVEVIQVLLP